MNMMFKICRYLYAVFSYKYLKEDIYYLLTLVVELLVVAGAGLLHHRVCGGRGPAQEVVKHGRTRGGHVRMRGLHVRQQRTRVVVGDTAVRLEVVQTLGQVHKLPPTFHLNHLGRIMSSKLESAMRLLVI